MDRRSAWTRCSPTFGPRDLRDSGRAVAPLAIAGDAALLDTSFLSIEASVQRAIAIVDARVGTRRAANG